MVRSSSIFRQILLTYWAAWVSINPHEQLVELLVVEALSKYFAKGCNELIEDARRFELKWRPMVNRCLPWADKTIGKQDLSSKDVCTTYLTQTQLTATIVISCQKGSSELHDVLQVDPLTGILLPVTVWNKHGEPTAWCYWDWDTLLTLRQYQILALQLRRLSD